MVDFADMAEEFQAMNLQDRINARAQFTAQSNHECETVGVKFQHNVVHLVV